MSDQLPAPAASNTFERIKRVNPAGAEFWSARELARVLEYSEFRHFLPVIEKAREACLNSAPWRIGKFRATPAIWSSKNYMPCKRGIRNWPMTRR